MSWPFSDHAKKVRRVLYGYFVDSGQSKDIGAIMKDTSLLLTEVQAALEELERGVMVMLQPGTHDVVKCPPWTNTPTCHAIARDQKHACYAGCCMEAINMSHSYPDEDIVIRTSCAWSGEPIAMISRNGRIREAVSSTILYIGTNPKAWRNNWFAACENNRFFASRANMEAWEKAAPGRRGAFATRDQIDSLATYRYELRFDFERGAEPETSGAMKLFQQAGMSIPEEWMAE